MDFPVSMGGYKFAENPDDPCVIQMICCPYGKVGAPKFEQVREARRKILALQFDDYEQEIRAHLNGMLPAELFNFDKDVASISVNRWAHGYAYSPNPLFDDVDAEAPHVVGRARFGRIAIANSDAGGSATIDSAIGQAHRAIEELDHD